MSAVWVALIVAVASMSGPLLLARQLNRQALAKEGREKKERDAVAAKAEQAADLLRQDSKLLAERTDEVARLAAEAAVATASQLDGIKTDVKVVHTLVNSDMTATMQALLVSLRAQLVSAQGRLDPSSADHVVLTELPERIAELEAKIDNRTRQAVKAEFIARGDDP